MSMMQTLEHAERLAAARRAKSLDALSAIDTADQLPVPAPVTKVVAKHHGGVPLLSAEAFELARQVYYLQHGSLTDAARAVVAAELSDVESVTKVRDRLVNWWQREGWPKRDHAAAFALRDANLDGGLIRSERTCQGITTGKGVAPAGASCGQSALEDSEFCFQHDPRPEYVAARKKRARELLEARLADSVPLQPFVDWCTSTRAELVENARRKGLAVHAADSGWALLAAHLQVSKSTLWRLVNKGARADGKTEATVRASTIVRYLAGVDDVSFEDIYGFAPPARRARFDESTRCPKCGERKNPESETCLDCFTASANQCNYRNRRGVRCTTSTRHPSGYCYHCRRIVERVPRPNPGRRSFLTDAMLTLATGAYAEAPTIAAVGRRMWAANAEGVREVFRNCQTLISSLVKYFAKHGWSTPEAIASAHEELVRRHGDVSWPAGAPSAVESSRFLPVGPFVTWLKGRQAEVGTYEALAARTGLHSSTIGRRLTGHDAPITRTTVETALRSWGDGSTLTDLYPEEGKGQ